VLCCLVSAVKAQLTLEDIDFASLSAAPSGSPAPVSSPTTAPSLTPTTTDASNAIRVEQLSLQRSPQAVDMALQDNEYLLVAGNPESFLFRQGCDMWYRLTSLPASSTVTWRQGFALLANGNQITSYTAEPNAWTWKLLSSTTVVGNIVSMAAAFNLVAVLVDTDRVYLLDFPRLVATYNATAVAISSDALVYALNSSVTVVTQETSFASPRTPSDAVVFGSTLALYGTTLLVGGQRGNQQDAVWVYTTNAPEPMVLDISSRYMAMGKRWAAVSDGKITQILSTASWQVLATLGQECNGIALQGRRLWLQGNDSVQEYVLVEVQGASVRVDEVPVEEVQERPDSQGMKELEKRTYRKAKVRRGGTNERRG